MTDRQRWQAVLDNDRRYDGTFFYGVASTGIFCRPSCPSRPPRRDRVRFFPTADAALAAGVRPCKRCRSDLLEYRPMREAAAAIKERLDRAASLDDVGLTPRRMTDVFSYDDLAIQRGLRMVYHHRAIDRRLFEKYRRRFSPYCSVASLYLWAVAGGGIPEMHDYKPKNG